MTTPFAKTLEAAAESIPHSVGGALAAGDGELVDSWSTLGEDEWAFLTAHVGILVNHVRCAMHTFHFGDVEWLSVHYAGLDLVIEQLGDKYFLLVASKPPTDLLAVADVVHAAAERMREEML
ncbi:MAG: hypothetical protein GY811_27305 [Myxococcales bacterium]|nr:hypothetical protein [Myxococcales bacterium]